MFHKSDVTSNADAISRILDQIRLDEETSSYDNINDAERDLASQGYALVDGNQYYNEKTGQTAYVVSNDEDGKVTIEVADDVELDESLKWARNYDDRDGMEQFLAGRKFALVSPDDVWEDPEGNRVQASLTRGQWRLENIKNTEQDEATKDEKEAITESQSEGTVIQTFRAVAPHILTKHGISPAKVKPGAFKGIRGAQFDVSTNAFTGRVFAGQNDKGTFDIYFLQRRNVKDSELGIVPTMKVVGAEYEVASFRLPKIIDAYLTAGVDEEDVVEESKKFDVKAAAQKESIRMIAQAAGLRPGAVEDVLKDSGANIVDVISAISVFKTGKKNSKNASLNPRDFEDAFLGDTKALKRISALSEETINESFSKLDTDRIEGVVKATGGKDIAAIVDQLKKRGFKNTKYVTSPMPAVIITQGKSTFAIVNKKYADEPLFVHGAMAGGLINEGMTVKDDVTICLESINEDKFTDSADSILNYTSKMKKYLDAADHGQMEKVAELINTKQLKAAAATIRGLNLDLRDAVLELIMQGNKQLGSQLTKQAI